jgi:serine/threonine protein kinase
MRIGPYEIEQEIGRGSMGVVYRAHAPSGAVVAVKLFKDGLGAEARARFDRERRLLDALGEAAGFVPLLDWGEAPRPFVVMPLLTGGTLRDRLERGPLRLAASLELARALATALGHAHGLGIVHRDLKSENILFTGEGRPLVADLGLAKHFAHGPHLTGISESVRLSQTGEARGTAGYMAPEQMDDSTRAGPDSDVFALGVILYECLAGAPPFTGATPLEAIARAARGDKVPLRELRPDVPVWLVKAIDRALAVNRNARFSNGSALALALEHEPSEPTREAPKAFPVEAYTLGEELGRGGAATVHKAIAPDGTACAMKLFKPGMVDRKKFEELKAIWESAERREAEQGVPVNRMRGVGVSPMKVIDAEIAGRKIDREVEMMKLLVPVLAVGDYRGQPSIVMPLFSGGTLRDRLRRFGAMPVAEALRIGTALARAMQEVHARGIVHRDLKPENVLFTEDATPCVSDLGLAKYVKTPQEQAQAAQERLSKTNPTFILTKTGEFRGTVGYAAPEQMEDASSAGAAADVYAIGSILYECLAGEPLIRGNGVPELWGQAMEARHVPLRKVRRDVPAAIADVVERCVQKNPADRYPDARMLALALEERDLSESSLPQAPARSRRYLGAAGAVLVLGAVLALVSTKLSSPRAPSESVSTTPRPSSSATLMTTPKPASSSSVINAPSWFLELPEAERPPYPLPANLTFGAAPGTYVNSKDESELVFVPHVAFVMGTADGHPFDGPPHEVELSSFFVGKYEVTNKQFDAFVKATRYKTTAENDQRKVTKLEAARRAGVMDSGLINQDTWRDPMGEGTPPDSFPVVQVSWADAEAYVAWAGVKLPSEAQWECAAAWDPKAKKARRYSWGDFVPGPGSPKVGNLFDETRHRAHPDLVKGVDWFSGYEDGWDGLAPVGTFPNGVSPCGALDMTGNAAEWCADGCGEVLTPYEISSTPPLDPVGSVSGATCRIVRGGCWPGGPSSAPNQLRQKLKLDDTGTVWLGFRVARRL